MTWKTWITLSELTSANLRGDGDGIKKLTGTYVELNFEKACHQAQHLDWQTDRRLLGTVEHSVVPIGSNWVVDVFRNRWWHGRTGACVCHCYLSNVGLPKDMVLLLLEVWLLHGLYNSNRAIIRPWMAKQPNNPRKALGWSQMTTDSSRQFPNPSPCHFNPTCHRSTPGFRRIRDSGDWEEQFLGFDPERPANSRRGWTDETPTFPGCMMRKCWFW